MDCPACSHANPAAARFCNACGERLPPSCPGCGHANPLGASFCNRCGTSLAGEEAPPHAEPALAEPGREPRAYTPAHLAERILRSRAALEGERKPVTVLFCDLADSTGVSAALGPEAMHEMMDRCFKIILEQVHRYEGTVNQFLGDGVMALFGAPLALEDGPRRAVTAALSIQRALLPWSERIEDEHGASFRMRIGIHAGPVVVGRIGDDLRMDYTAVGDTTILAHRLQEAALAGSVLVSETVANQVEGWFELDDLGPVEAKGLGAVPAFRVARERVDGGRVEARAAAGLTPLVGRERALETLERAFGVVESGRGQVVFLVGEAGIGKSRLLYEFRERLGDRARWVEGRCASYAGEFAFHPIADGLRRGFGIDDRDSDEAALAKIEAFEETIDRGLDWTLPFVRQILSLPSGDPEADALDPGTRRMETFRALRARVQRAAERSPFVLAIEDLHWIDRQSEEFLEFLGDAIPASRVLLLLTHRPGYRHPFGDRSYHERLLLQPLTRPEMDQMANSVLETEALPAELRQLIARKAEGNPFFVEEVTQSLLEDGSLVRRGNRIELARRLADISVPDSIHGVLQARLDRLPEAPKRALQLASVIGREFALRLLERIVEDGPTIGPVVDELRALELIYEKAAHPELAYMFKHALTHDVAYDSVLVTRRRALHKIVGIAIEELYRDRLAEHYAALAHHFSEAEEWEKAFLYHVRSAQSAQAVHAMGSAAEHCRRALGIAERLGDAVPREQLRALEQGLGAAAYARSAFQESGDAFRRAAELSDEPLDEGLNLGRASNSYFWGHRYDETIAMAEAAAEVGRAHDCPDAEGYGLLMDGFEAAIQGDFARYDRRLREVRKLDPRNEEVRFTECYLIGQRAEWRADWETAERSQAEGVEIAEKVGIPGSVVLGAWFRAKALCCVGRYVEALALIDRGLDISEKLGDRAQRTRMFNTLGWMYAEMGCDERAIELNERSLDIAAEMHALGLVVAVPEPRGNALVNLACNRIVLGDFDAAAEGLAQVREGLETDEDPWMRWRYSLHLLDAEARLALARGEPEQARALAEEERRLATEREAPKLVVRALEVAGRAELAMDDRDGAREHLQTALSGAREIGYAPVQWRALALLSELDRRTGARGRGRETNAEAQELIRRHIDAGLPEALGRSLERLADRIAADPTRLR